MKDFSLPAIDRGNNEQGADAECRDMTIWQRTAEILSEEIDNVPGYLKHWALGNYSDLELVEFLKLEKRRAEKSAMEEWENRYAD